MLINRVGTGEMASRGCHSLGLISGENNLPAVQATISESSLRRSACLHCGHIVFHLSWSKSYHVPLHSHTKGNSAPDIRETIRQPSERMQGVHSQLLCFSDMDICCFTKLYLSRACPDLMCSVISRLWVGWCMPLIGQSSFYRF